MFLFRHETEVQETDRRREPRFEMFSIVDLCDETGSPFAEATIRELSENGAHLSVRSAGILPERLIIRSRYGQNSYPARLKWETGDKIGVEFDEVMQSRSHR